MCAPLIGFTFEAATGSDDGIDDLRGVGTAARGEKNRVDSDGEYSDGRWLGWSTAARKGSAMLPDKGGDIPDGFEALPAIWRREGELPGLCPLIDSFVPLAVHRQAGRRQDTTVERAAG